MSPLLAPLFAQLVSLQVGERTEARYVTLPVKQAIGSATPYGGLNLTSGRYNLQLSYAPLLLVAPLDSSPRQLYVLHNAAANLSYQTRRTTYSFANSVSYGTLNFQLLAAQGPSAVNPNPAPTTGNPTTGMPTTGNPTTGMPTTGNPTTGMPTTGNPTTGTPGNTSSGVTRGDVVDGKVRYYAITNTLGVSHAVTRQVTLGAQAGTSVGRGLDDRSLAIYPGLRGWFLGGNAGYAYRVDARNTLNSTVGLFKTWSSNGNEAATFTANEVWNHAFDKRSTAALGAGINVTRFSLANGLRGLSVFPTFNASVSHQTLLGRGSLYFGANAYSAPALDPLRAIVDPRVGVGGFIGYTRRRLTLGSTASTSLSVAPSGNNTGAVNAALAEVRASYLVGKYTMIDAGTRVSYQTYQLAANDRATVIPLNWGAFVGVSFGYQVQLAGSKK